MAIMPGELPAQLAQLYSASEAETREYGRRLAAVVPRPAMILLQGELGAGKTQLAKGLILGLGAAASEAEVVSPSYTLVHEYAARQGRVFHLDLYRLETPRELASLGMEEFMPAGPGGATSVVIVEWGGKLVQAGERSWLAGGWLEINIEITGGEQRHIQAAWHRARSARSLGLRPNAGH
jgi:tRNA threonylcarbamoyladenosine biosynthesis protein TsaE